MAPWFLAVAGGIAIIAGATASIVGFGIGSLLTPLIAWKFGSELPSTWRGQVVGWQT